MNEVLIENKYYNNYYLDDIYDWDLTDNDKMILDSACLVVNYNYSLRQLSKEVGRSKSQLSRDFQKLKYISYELWKLVQNVFKNNKNKYFK